MITETSNHAMQPTQVYEVRPRRDKRGDFLATILSGLILCIFCPISLQALGGAPNKTDAELAEAMIGTWELLPGKEFTGFSKIFLTFNADGTSKVIGITNDRGAPRRSEVETRWRLNHGYLMADVIKTTPANRIHFEAHDQIVSIDKGMARLRDRKGNKSDMRRIDHLPTLPPLLTPTGVPTISGHDFKKIAISTPQPDYPIDARRNRTQGRGLFKLVLTKEGQVGSIEVLKSTRSKVLDDAAEKALRQWRFQAGVVRGVRVPINFVLR